MDQTFPPLGPRGPGSSHVQLNPLASSYHQPERSPGFDINDLPLRLFNHLDSRVHPVKNPIREPDSTANYKVDYPALPGSVAQSSSASAVPRRLAALFPSDETGYEDDEESSGRKDDPHTKVSEGDSALRSEFNNLYQNAIQLGFHNSPCFPQTLAEYTKVRSHIKYTQEKALSNKKRAIRRAEKQYERALEVATRRACLIRDAMAREDIEVFDQFIETPLAHGPVQPVFYSHPGIAQDGRAAVLARETCFSKPDPSTPHQDLWPSESTFKTFRGSSRLPPPARQVQFPPRY